MTAVLFPGQGSHRAGMAAAWEGHRAAATFDEIGRVIGLDLAVLADDPTACAHTEVAQPVVYAASIAAWRALADEGIRPDLVAGHSLGEISAFVAAGALTVADGARVVAERGRAMGRACRAEPGGMAAVLRLDDEQAALLTHELTALRPYVVVANDNAAGQIVLSGSTRALAAGCEIARQMGGIVRQLDVEGAFHSPAMTSAVVAVDEVLDRVELHATHTPVLSAVTATEVTEPAAAHRALCEGVLARVRWRAVQERLVARGVTEAIEAGPGGVLRGLARRALPGTAVHAVDGADSLAELLAGPRATASSAPLVGTGVR